MVRAPAVAAAAHMGDTPDTATSVVSLSDFTWPTPPPSPPVLPPLPPPERRLNVTADQLECQFEQGIDLTVSSSAQHKPSAAHAVDSQQQCCALCALKSGCSRFVYIPGSGVCALLPHVPKIEILRTSNPATVAGALFLARAELSAPERPHAHCTFEVGYGYAKGALGAGRPLDEPQITSQQACCDACDRNPECVKFVFEKYGGGCQLFEAFSERIKTPGLIAGQITARLAIGYTPSMSEDGIAPSPPPPFESSPAPPTLGFSLLPPPLPPSDEGGAAEAVLAYGSIVVGGFMVMAVLLCTYCFYFGEIQGLLHQWTRGRYGKAKFSLLPKSLQELELAANAEPDTTEQQGKKKKKKSRGKEVGLLGHKGPPEGHASVACETENVTQKKNVEVADCASYDELLDRVWEEFGHVLKAMRPKDMALMCWVPSAPPDANEGEWMLLTKASDMTQATTGHALKLAHKQLISDFETRPVAFVSQIPNKKRSKTPARTAAAEDVADAGQQAAAPSAAAEPPRRAVEDVPTAPSTGLLSMPIQDVAERHLRDKDEEDSDDQEDAQPMSGRRAHAIEEWSDDGAESGPSRSTADATDAVFLQSMKACAAQRQSSRTSALDLDVTAMAAEIEQSSADRGVEPLCPTLMALATTAGDDGTAQGPRVGERVRMCNLVSMADLNGRTGVVVSFDSAKSRYRVRLDGGPGDDVERPRVMAFKASNLEGL